MIFSTDTSFFFLPLEVLKPIRSGGTTCVQVALEHSHKVDLRAGPVRPPRVRAHVGCRQAGGAVGV